MSLENVKRFMDAVNQDPALQQRLVATSDPAESLRLAVEAGAERGLPFTPEEFVAGIRTMTQENIPNANAGELSDSELNQVAGGEPVSLAIGMVIGSALATTMFANQAKVEKAAEAVVAPIKLWDNLK